MFSVLLQCILSSLLCFCPLPINFFVFVFSIPFLLSCRVHVLSWNNSTFLLLLCINITQVKFLFNFHIIFYFLCSYVYLVATQYFIYLFQPMRFSYHICVIVAALFVLLFLSHVQSRKLFFSPFLCSAICALFFLLFSFYLVCVSAVVVDIVFFFLSTLSLECHNKRTAQRQQKLLS